ncbi:MAG TPA: vWA domain-containing protein [Thermoanaerobaculia bacterium]|nr:vWA domain-containing protein [Thermoanaerobaculia bacterium]
MSMLTRAAAAFLCLTFLAWPPLLASVPPPAKDTEFQEEIDVRISTIVLRVVDGRGEPIRGLGPQDFRVRVGKKEVPVVAVDWFAAGEAPPKPPEPSPATEPTSGEPAAAPAPLPAGRLVVFFVQADNNSAVRTRGHLKTLPYVKRLLRALDDEDRLAVVSFDSHLKLWQDFVSDRDTTYAAIARAVRFSATPPVVPLGEPPSIAQSFDVEKAKDIASPERALAATAAALRPLGGEKILIFLGWGLGRFGAGGTTMTPGFTPAIRELARAHTSVFVLDVTDAGAHDLAVGLEAVADATGGTYAKTVDEPDLAIRELVRTISGYYVLTLDPDQLPTGIKGDLRVDLRKKRGTVLVRPAKVR